MSRLSSIAAALRRLVRSTPDSERSIAKSRPWPGSSRLQISSAQLPTYFVGYQEWLDLRAAAEQRPGFTLRTFHDEALSHGSPPVRFIRQLMFGEPIR